MTKLSDFAGTILNTEKINPSVNQETKSAPSSENDDLMKKYNELKDLPEDELSKKLMQEAAKQKQEGTFNYEALASMLTNIKGMVPDESYQNMLRILETLR